MKKTPFFAAILLCSFATEAVVADLTTFRLSDILGNAWSFPAEALKLKPVGDMLVVTSSDGSNTSLDLNLLARAGFTTDVNSSITSPLDTNEACTVYSISGLVIGNFDSTQEAKNTLSQGVYIVKTKSATHKLLLK